MLKQTLFSAAILVLTLAGQASAQRFDRASTPAERPTTDISRSEQSDEVAVALLSATAWISSVFSLPEPRTVPAVRRFSSQTSAFRPLTDTQSDVSVHAALESYYDDGAKTIYLPGVWTGSTPAEMSALVHAVARHFQNVGTRKYYDCPEQRNELPYDAQARWLGLYDRTLTEEFGIEQATLLLVTQCVP